MIRWICVTNNFLQKKVVVLFSFICAFASMVNVSSYLCVASSCVGEPAQASEGSVPHLHRVRQGCVKESVETCILK